MDDSAWEIVEESFGTRTMRLKVEGGHLYETEKGLCFVPDIDLKRYESHLRDAYTQGYKAGQDDAKQGVNQP